MVEATRLGEGQPVGRLQRRPAVGTREELVRQTEPQLCRFGFAQIGDARDAELLCLRLEHRQRISVVEAERHRHFQAVRREPAVQLGKRRIAFALQQFANDRAGVLGINVDRSRRERLLEDPGVAQALLVLGGDAGVLQGLTNDLAEDVRLGEALRADGERRRRNRGGACRKRDGPRQNADRNLPPHELPLAAVGANSFARFRA